jgi:nitroreductase
VTSTSEAPAVSVDTERPAAWRVDAADFPPGGDVADALRFCVRYAILAPSGHNAQPWWFRVEHDAVIVGLDPSRGLPVVDPDDREGLISVGAATFFLRVAAARFGFGTRVQLWPDPRDPEACARVRFLPDGPADPELIGLFDAIAERHTNRTAFRDDRVETDVVQHLVSVARDEGATLQVAPADARQALADLIAEGDRRQLADRRFRRELAAWLRPTSSQRADGLHGFLDRSPLASIVGPLVVRTFDLGAGRAATDTQLATGSPLLCVVTTARDDRTAWLSAGQALARVLLEATAAGLAAGFLNQPIEVEELRNRVAAAMDTAEHPQLLLRLGHASPARPQPRRPLDDVLA